MVVLRHSGYMWSLRAPLYNLQSSPIPENYISQAPLPAGFALRSANRKYRREIERQERGRGGLALGATAAAETVSAASAGWWLRRLRAHLQCRRPRFDPWVGKIAWIGAWQCTPVCLPGESPRTEESGRLPSVGSQRAR